MSDQDDRDFEIRAPYIQKILGLQAKVAELIMTRIALAAAILLCLWMAWQIADGYHKAQMTAAFMAGMDYERLDVSLTKPVAEWDSYCAEKNARAGRKGKK